MCVCARTGVPVGVPWGFFREGEGGGAQRLSACVYFLILGGVTCDWYHMMQEARLLAFESLGADYSLSNPVVRYTTTTNKCDHIDHRALQQHWQRERHQ